VILHPAIIALLLSSIIICLMVVYCSYHGWILVRKWDITSGSELQLQLERRTYLVSTVLGYVFAFELVSLFLYIFTAENLHSMFVGAMCAAGTLNAGDFGYSTLLVKILVFFLAGLWLIINHANNKAHDYPLIKQVYVLLLVIAPITVVEMVLQSIYLLHLRADVITSCCGSLFSSSAAAVSPSVPFAAGLRLHLLLWPALFLVVVQGAFVLAKGRGASVFALFCAAAFVVSIVSVITYISPYIYELPTHACPFCILQAEYNYRGYVLYVSLFGGTLTGMGAGAVDFFGQTGSLREIMPRLRSRLVLISLTAFLVFALLVACSMVFSNLKS